MSPGRPRGRPRRRARGVPGEPDDPTALGDALAAVGAELGLSDPGALSALSARWSEVVGPDVAPHARFRSLRAGVLTVGVDSGPWATQLRFLETTLRERVADVVGADVVQSVRVVVEPPS